MSTEPDDLKPFTRALAGVSPHPGQLDRDELLFAAGRAAGRRSVFWPAAVGVLAALCSALVVTLAVRPPTIVEVERVVYIPTPAVRELPPPEPVPTQEDPPAPTPTPPSPALAEGLRLRQRVLQDGVNALPEPPWTSSSTSSDKVPDLTSLRLNAVHLNGERFR